MSQQTNEHTHHRKPGPVLRILGWVMGLSCLVLIGYLGRHLLGFDTDGFTEDAQVQQLMTPLNARVGGYIREVRYSDFDAVSKGDTLVVIDNTDYLIQEQLTEAALMDARAGRTVTSSTVDVASNTVAISEARIQEVKARLRNAESNYHRYEVLLAKESVTPQQFDQVQSEYLALKAQVDASEKARAGSRLAAREAGTRIAVNEAAIQRAEAQLNAARLNLKYTVILAPCNGYLGRRSVEAGQLVQAGQQLGTIVDRDTKWVTANFREKQLRYIRPGQRVILEVDAMPGKKIGGVVQALAAATGSAYSLVPVDNATGNFVKIQQRIPVKIGIDRHTDPALFDQLRSGMNVIVQLQ